MPPTELASSARRRMTTGTVGPVPTGAEMQLPDCSAPSRGNRIIARAALTAGTIGLPEPRAGAQCRCHRGHRSLLGSSASGPAGRKGMIGVNGNCPPDQPQDITPERRNNDCGAILETWNLFALREHRPRERMGGNFATVRRCRGRDSPDTFHSQAVRATAGNFTFAAT